MGLFIVDLEEPETVDSMLKTAIANIELFQRLYPEGSKYSNVYLLKDFAMMYLERAITEYEINLKLRVKEDVSK